MRGEGGVEEGGEERRVWGEDPEVNASIEVLLQEPELVLQDPTSSQTGLALRGLLVAQVASRVSVRIHKQTLHFLYVCKSVCSTSIKVG